MMEDLVVIGLSNGVVATLLAVVVYVVTRVFRHAPFAHLLWLLVLLKLITPPIFLLKTPIPMAIEFSPGNPSGSATINSFDSRSDASLDSRAKQTEKPESSFPHANISANPTGLVAASTEPPAQQLNDPGIPYSFETTAMSAIFAKMNEIVSIYRQQMYLALVAIWAAGSIAMTILSFKRLRSLRNLIRRTAPAPAELTAEVNHLVRIAKIRNCPDVRVCNARIAPFVVSIGHRAVMMLPETFLSTLSTQQRTTILAHELAHLKRGDQWWTWIGMLAVILYWWHPVAWFARHQLGQEAEQCCDGWVLNWFPNLKEAYAEILLKTVDFVSGVVATPPEPANAFGQFPILKRRLTMVLNNKPEHRIPVALRGLSCFLGAIILSASPLFILTSSIAQEISNPKTEAAGASIQTPSTAPTDVIAPSKALVDDWLKKAAESINDADKNLNSVVGEAVFETTRIVEGIDEPVTMIKGRVKVFYEKGKYRLEFKHEKYLTRGDNGNGEIQKALVDVKVDDVVIIADVDAVYVVSFSDLFQPARCKIDIYNSLSDVMGMQGLRIKDPAKLWQSQRADTISKLIDEGKVKIEKSTENADGSVTQTYLKTPEMVRFEKDMLTTIGYLPIETRAFKTTDTQPFQRERLDWRRIDGHWFPLKTIFEFPLAGAQKSTFEFQSFEPNKEVDPKLFMISSVAIPPRTRTIDHRLNQGAGGYAPPVNRGEAKPERTVPFQKPSIDDETILATQKALKAHTLASTVDLLPRFFVFGRATVNRDIKPGQSIEGFQKLLELQFEKVDFVYFSAFGWDQNHFIVGDGIPEMNYNPMVSGVENVKTNGSNYWGDRDRGGQSTMREHEILKSRTFSSIREIWNNTPLSVPSFPLVTRHRFWWGDNSSHNHQLMVTGIPPNRAVYRSVGEEKWDGEICEIFESSNRLDRLWVSKTTGLIRGYAAYYGIPKVIDFRDDPDVQKITGRTFETDKEWNAWMQAEYWNLADEDRMQLDIAVWSYMRFSEAHPGVLVRFGDYREISRNVWWPFREERVQSGILTRFEVKELKTDLDLTDVIKAQQPK